MFRFFLSILHWRCPFGPRFDTCLSSRVFFQYSIGDAWNLVAQLSRFFGEKVLSILHWRCLFGTMPPLTRLSTFNTPLEMLPTSAKAGRGTEYTPSLSILHWRCFFNWPLTLYFTVSSFQYSIGDALLPNARRLYFQSGCLSILHWRCRADKIADKGGIYITFNTPLEMHSRASQ